MHTQILCQSCRERPRTLASTLITFNISLYVPASRSSSDTSRTYMHNSLYIQLGSRSRTRLYFQLTACIYWSECGSTVDGDDDDDHATTKTTRSTAKPTDERQACLLRADSALRRVQRRENQYGKSRAHDAIDSERRQWHLCPGGTMNTHKKTCEKNRAKRIEAQNVGWLVLLR